MKTKSYLSIFFVIFVILATGTALTVLAIRVQDRRMREEFLIQARMLKSAINVKRIMRLSGSTIDLNSLDYQRLKKQLALARSANSRCRFIYLMGQKEDGKVFFFVDSERQYSKDYSPPGQVYSEVTRPLLDAFAIQKEAVEGPISDRWGRWVSALVPVVDPETGKTIAVLGIDIDARSWMALIVYYSLSPALLTLLIFIIWETYIFVQRRNEQDRIRQAKSRMALRDSEANFQRLFENMADGMAIYQAINEGEDFVFVDLNRNGEKISQVKCKDIIGKRVTEVFPAVAEIGLLEVLRRVWKSGVSEYLPGVFYKDKRIEHWSENYVLKLPSGMIVSIYSNVSKRRQAEEDIRSLAKCLAENPNPVLRVAKDGTLLLVNQSAFKQLADWRLRIGRMVPAMLKDLASKSLERGSDQQCEIGYGDQLFSFYVTPIIESGYVNLYGLNITERKAIENELNWKTELLEAEKEASLDGLLVVDEKGRKILTNRRLLELWQIPQYIVDDKNDETLLKYVMGMVKDPQQFLDKVNYLYAHREETSKDEVEFKNGMVFSRYSSPVIDKRGKYLGRIWTFRDITERKQAERKISEYTERLSYLTKYANDLIMLLDENFILLEFNERAQDAYGYSRDELVGKHATYLRAPEIRGMFAQQIGVAQNKGTVVFETLHQRKSGEKFPVEISLRAFDAGGKKFYQAVIRDITERKKTEEELNRVLREEIKSREKMALMLEDNNRIRERLEKSLEKLKETQSQLIHAEKMEAIGRMASGVAHEVKNPLGIILQGTTYLEGKLSPGDKDNYDVLKMIKDSVKRADNIVRALLDFSRAEEFKTEEQDINTVIESSIDLVRHKFRANSVELLCKLENSLPKTCIDRGKIEQVFVNLFNNAADAMQNGGRLYTRTYLSELKTLGNKSGNRENDIFRLGEKAIIVEVEDTGIGMDQRTMSKIFDPFFTTKNRAEGTGLGLSIVKNIIEMHKSLINVESEKDKGTKFTIVFKISGQGRD